MVRSYTLQPSTNDILRESLAENKQQKCKNKIREIKCDITSTPMQLPFRLFHICALGCPLSLNVFALLVAFISPQCLESIS